MTNKASVDSLDAQVGQAWSYHYRKQNDLALKEFRKLVEQAPAHIDANYGLALVLATLGEKTQAMDAFRHTADLVNARINSQQADDEDSRYRMLARMVSQQLEALERA